MVEKRSRSVPELHIEPAAVAGEMLAFIRQAVSDFQREGAIVGLSGGIDSAVMVGTRGLHGPWLNQKEVGGLASWRMFS